MRFVLSLGVIAVVLAAQIAAKAGPPGEGGGQRGGEEQGHFKQGQSPHSEHPTLNEHARQNDHPRQDAQFDKLHRIEHWPSNWTWRWYPGRGWYAPNGSYLVARPILDPILIVNPPENRATLNYTLNGARYSIPPGHSQELNDDRPWVIEFSRGGGFGQAQYTLQPGRYHFAGSPGGWELFGTEPPAAGPPGLPPANPSLPGQGNQPPLATVPPSLPGQGNQPPPPPTGPSSPAQGVQPPPTGPSSPGQGVQPPPPTGPSSPGQGVQPPPQATDPSSPAQGTQPPPLPPGPF
jgi:hypothetical protein